MEVDAEADGSRVREFLRIRVDLPLGRRLQTKITIGKDPAKQVIYPLRYERVPHYCFWCGFIGHDGNQCEKKRLGVPTRAYDEGLRCSPYRKFENRSAFVAPGTRPAARRGLNFASNAPSEVLGKPRERRRGKGSQEQQQTTEIPVRVDAHDGFGEHSSSDGHNVDTDISDRVLAMRVHLAGQRAEPAESVRCGHHLNLQSSSSLEVEYLRPCHFQYAHLGVSRATAATLGARI